MIPLPQMKQNKIEGMSIAWARGKWAEIEAGVWGYIFPEDDAFAIRKTPQELEAWGVSHDDLYDCIALIEEMFGAPRDHRLSFGLLPNQGYSNIGTTVKSRTNPSITCTFTPTSLEDNSYDGYFNWYYHENGGIEGIKSFMTRFDMATDTRTTNILASPTMPTYGEACDRTAGILSEAERERFVNQVWNYHKTAPRGYKIRIEAEILPQWKKILEANSLGEFLDDFASDVLKKSFSGFLKSLKVKKRGTGFDIKGYTRSDLEGTGHFMFHVGGRSALEVKGMLSIPDRDDHQVSFNFTHQKFTKDDVIKAFKREFDLR